MNLLGAVMAIALSILNPQNPLGDNLSVNEAKSAFESKYNTKMLLPTYVPFTPTHIGGDLKKTMLRIRYFNEKTQHTMLLDIIPKTETLYDQIFIPHGDEVKLIDGTKGKYYHDSNLALDRIHFVKNNIGYRIYIGKNNGPVPLSDLLKVADSLR
ncbi:hypothetical protein [Cohnella candidum]|uniref:hypothetical protein n=1 Tax=Cohnella candidum TaxID=2674991 RepID=UPI0013DDEDEC|nr:hypothetical protein [Cohnella candidum]